MQTLLYPTINFTILVVLLFIMLRKPVAAFALARHNQIRTTVFEVREQLRRAHEKFEEFSAKLSAVEVETDALRAQSKREAERFRERVVAAAETTAKGIVEDARTSADNSYTELRDQLRVETGLLVIQRAEEVIKKKLSGIDKSKMIREFSSLVESA